MEGIVHQKLVEVGKTYYYDGVTVSTSPGCTVVSHAERNGIAFAAREGIRLLESDVFCTHAPCVDCARSLLGSGIRSLTYQTPYRLTAGVELIRSAGIKVVDLSVSQMVG
jgi:dCMP deaminase